MPPGAEPAQHGGHVRLASDRQRTYLRDLTGEEPAAALTRAQARAKIIAIRTELGLEKSTYKPTRKPAKRSPADLAAARQAALSEDRPWHPRREQVRTVACPRCDAPPDKWCRGTRGPRKSNHRERVERYLRMTT